MRQELQPAEMNSKPPRRFRILSFDGGPSGLRYLENLKRIVEIMPDFLGKVDMFTGTSSGSFLALYLASQEQKELENGPEVIERLLNLQMEFLKSVQPKGLLERLSRGVGFLSGCRPLLSEKGLLEFLHRDDVFGQKKLRDLNKYIALVTLRLFTTSRDNKELFERPWGPHIFHNLFPDLSDPNYTPAFDRFYFGNIEPEFRDLSLAELMTRSGALPIFSPIHAGYIDGGVFANNPEVVSVAQTLNALSWINYKYNQNDHGEFQSKGWIRGTEDILLFSFGGQDQRFSTRSVEERLHKARDASPHQKEHLLQWGWGNWLFRPRSPLLLLKLLLGSDARGNNQQINHLMQAITSFRLSTQSGQGMINDLFTAASGAGSHKLAREAKTQAEQWVKHSPKIVTFLADVLQSSGILPPPETTMEPSGSPTRESSSQFKDPLDRLTFAALRQLGYSLQQSKEVTKRYKQSRGHLAALAAMIMNETEWKGDPVKERVRLLFNKTDPLTQNTRALVHSFIQLLSKQPTSPHYSKTYLVTLLWLALIWYMPDAVDHDQSLLHLLGEPFYFIPLLEYFQEIGPLSE